jgi:hypothetical protein
MKYTFNVHTIGGETLEIRASKFTPNEKENLIRFEDVDESESGVWTVYLSGVAAIHRLPDKGSAEKEISAARPVIIPQENPWLIK